MTQFFRICWTSILLFPFSVNAAEATTPKSKTMVVIDNRQQSQTFPNTQSRIFASENRARIEVRGNRIRQNLIYWDRKQVLWVVDLDRQTKMRMDRTVLAKTQEAIKTAFENMKDRYHLVGPKFQEKIRNYVRGLDRMKKIRYRKTQSQVSVGKWTCDDFTGKSQGGPFQLQLQHCTVPWIDTGTTQKEVDVLRRLYVFLVALSSSTGPPPSIPWGHAGFPGFPVRTKSFANGKQDHQLVVESIQKAKYQPDLFEIPSGFQEIPFPESD